MIYRIRLTGPSPNISTTRKRADAAHLAARKVAYDVIAGFGGLDTQQGHTAMAKVEQLDPRRGGMVEMYGCVLFVTCSHS